MCFHLSASSTRENSRLTHGFNNRREFGVDLRLIIGDLCLLSLDFLNRGHNLLIRRRGGIRSNQLRGEQRRETSKW